MKKGEPMHPAMWWFVLPIIVVASIAEWLGFVI